MDTDKIIALIDEAKKAKYSILAGAEELAYEHAQNLEDELTVEALKRLKETDPKEDPKTQEKTPTQPPQRVEV